MKKINLTAAFTPGGIKFSALENHDNQGSYRQLSIDPNKTITEILKDVNLVASKATLAELIHTLSDAATIADDLPIE